MITIDYTNRTPVYEQIVDSVEKLIALGILKPNDKLPSVRSLGIELSTNPNTIQKAYTTLEQRGVTYSVKGIGNFVAEKDIKSKKLEEIHANLSTLLSSAVTYGLEEGELDRWMGELKSKLFNKYPNQDNSQGNMNNKKVPSDIGRNLAKNEKEKVDDTNK